VKGTVEKRFRIRDMDCPSCVTRIQDRLERLPGVREAAGNRVSRRLRVLYDPRELNPDAIREEVGRLGYTASDEDDERPEAEPVGTWSSPEAARTWVSGALMLLGLALRVAGGGPVLDLPIILLSTSGLLFVLAALVAGWNFFSNGVRAVRTLSLDMNFLMTVAILGAVGIGEYMEAGAIAFLFSLAELLEDFSVDRARRSIESLLDLSPDTATLVVEGREETRLVEAVSLGELVIVRPGERIPVDGTVEEGASAVDQSPVTGESMPVEKGEGDEIFAGTVNGEGHLRIRVEKEADETTLARMIHLVEEAEGRKTRSERFVERFARWYTPAVTLGAVLLAAGPPLLVGAAFDVWFVRGLTLLVIACPCALVISTPVAVVSGVTAAARNGVLIKGGVHLEAMGEVDVVAFDKTGTLTRGHAEVVEVVPSPGADLSSDRVLALAAAFERRSEHPLARAVVRAGAEEGAPDLSDTVEGFEAVPGRGVRGRIGGEEWVVGKPDLFMEVGEVEADLRRLRQAGRTVVLVGPPDRPVGLLALADRSREGARAAILRLRDAGVKRLVMLTGDNAETARAIAEELGLDEFHADLLPEEKVDVVKALETGHGRVAMVGDGVNDAPALAAASVGIAMGAAGSDAVIETADVALMSDELTKLAYLYRLSHRGRSVIRQNIGASIGLKGVLALGVPLGWVSLIVAVVVGDMGASLGVIGNSVRLGRVRA